LGKLETLEVSIDEQLLPPIFSKPNPKLIQKIKNREDRKTIKPKNKYKREEEDELGMKKSGLRRKNYKPSLLLLMVCAMEKKKMSLE
jgi:hypothetical protein